MSLYRRPPWNDGTYFDDGTGWLEDLATEDRAVSAAEIREQLITNLAEARAEAQAQVEKLQALLAEIDAAEAALGVG